MRLAFLALALSLVPACDSPAETCAAGPQMVLAPPDVEDDSELTFREAGPPHAVYITSLAGKPIGRKSFAALVAACKQADPPLTVTLTNYQMDTLKSEQVMGLGFSAVAPASLFQCYAQIFAANGAVELP